MADKKTPDNEANWSGAAKVGAAIGSAALVAALLYAGRRNLTQKKGKLEPQSPVTKNQAVEAATPNIKPAKKPKRK